MKIKTITLGIRSYDDTAKEAKDVMKRLSKGEIVKAKSPGIYFENISAMRKVITDERLRILKIIKKNRPQSIYELAKILKRDVKNVNEDVHYLTDLGLIKLSKIKEGRKKITPSVDYEKILLEISL